MWKTLYCHICKSACSCVYIGREAACLQDFELMQTRQGVRVDECQVIPSKSSGGDNESKLYIYKFNYWLVHISKVKTILQNSSGRYTRCKKQYKFNQRQIFWLYRPTAIRRTLMMSSRCAYVFCTRCARSMYIDVQCSYLHLLLFQIYSYSLYFYINILYIFLILYSSLCYKNFCVAFFWKMFVFGFFIHFAQ